jgi:thrombospondin type 3 repeat protein
MVAMAIVALQAIGASAAVGAPCRNVLMMQDAGGHGWDFLDGTGVVADGGLDAYDLWGSASVDGSAYNALAMDTCAIEPDGRQLDLPEVDLSGLKVSRKLFVPASGTAFARWVTFLRNPSGAPITVKLTFDGGLGSNNDTTLLATSSGDALTVDPANDSWVVSADSATAPIDPPLAHVFDSSATGVADRVDHLLGTLSGGGAPPTSWKDGQDAVSAVYDGVTVPAHATVSYMQIDAQRSTIDEAKAAAPALGAGPAEVFADLTDAEVATLRNWNGSDVDRDGIPNAADDCSRVANRDQADLDRDRIGDACDPDVDNDGVSNADEALRHTDPRRADTDGDGVGDAKDACPAVAGRDANGCPLASASVPAPKLKLSVAGTVRLKALLKGIKVSATPSVASALRFDLYASATGARIARAYNLVLATATVRRGTGKRTVTLRPSRRLIGRSRRFTLSLRVTATNGSGVSAVAGRTIRVRG